MNMPLVGNMKPLIKTEPANPEVDRAPETAIVQDDGMSIDDLPF